MNTLLSPCYFKNEGFPNEQVGRSFFREDLGYGQIESGTHGLTLQGRIKLFDLSGLREVTLDTTVLPEYLSEDENAQKATEFALEYALRAFPGAPPSIYEA